jgi:hypothetical protein
MLLMVPLFLEHSVQRNVKHALREIMRMFFSFSMLFYPFSMQTKGHNFGYAVNYGRAGYVATGRGYHINPSSMVTLYGAYGPSHVYFGMEIAFMAALYECWKAPGVSFISTWGTWSICIALIFAPWLFNPQSLTRSTLATSWIEWTQWLYGVGALPKSVALGSWEAWAEERLALKRSAGPSLKMRLVLRNLSSKLLVGIACAYGLKVPIPRTARGGLSGFMYHGLFFGRACLVVLIGSVCLRLGVRALERTMIRLHCTRLLPLLSAILIVAAYLGFALVLLVFEHNGWEGLAQLHAERNVWVSLFGALAMQAGAVQALGALADTYRYQATFTIWVLGPVDKTDEGAMSIALARHLKVHAADIAVSTRPRDLIEEDARGAHHGARRKGAIRRAVVSAQLVATKPLVQTAQAEGSAATAAVTGQMMAEATAEVTVTVATRQKLVANKTSACLNNLTPRTLSAVLGRALGRALTIRKVSNVTTSHALLNTGLRARALAYAQFYQRVMDMMMTLIIFGTLFLLSFLPILRLQSSILFNRQFADLLNRKVHRQQVLDELYTPGSFDEIEADEAEQATPRAISSSIGKLRRHARPSSDLDTPSGGGVVSRSKLVAAKMKPSRVAV